jgi:hypothetical protein
MVTARETDIAPDFSTHQKKSSTDTLLTPPRRLSEYTHALLYEVTHRACLR